MLPASKIEKMRDGFLFGPEHVCPLAATSADPSPAAHDRGFAEQGRLDCERTIARHVAAGVDTLAVEMKRHSAHAGNHFLRRSMLSNESFESVAADGFRFVMRWRVMGR
jgi:hypothetical protein